MDSWRRTLEQLPPSPLFSVRYTTFATRCQVSIRLSASQVVIVPIRAKRAGPNNQVVQQHIVYIRRPGPRSEQPLSAREWDELFARCLDARRDELMERIRDLLTGKPLVAENGSQPSRLDAWVGDCERIWTRRIETLPADSPSRCPYGFFTLAYELDAAKRPAVSELLEILGSAPHLTGWNTWWVPTRLNTPMIA